MTEKILLTDTMEQTANIFGNFDMNAAMIEKAVALCTEAAAAGHPEAVWRLAFYFDKAFVEAVLTGDRSGIRSDYADALKSHKMVYAANESMESGQVIYF